MEKMKISKRMIFMLGTLFFAFYCFAGIKFGDADINKNDEILYTVRQEIPGAFSYRSLFKANIKDGVVGNEPALISCFPEQMELLCGGKILQVRNRYGTAWFDTATKAIEWKKYSAEIPVNSLRLSKEIVSPNGEWICYAEKNGYATGKLFLKNVNSLKVVCLDENSAFKYENVSVKWSADSSVLVYAKNGNVYFCNPSAVIRGVEVDEKFRKIGPGTINSVNWTDGKFLVYIDSDLVYKISAKELYTLGLYSGIIGKGQMVGRLPSQFMASKDSFSVNSDVSSMVLIQNGKIFTYFKINRNTCDYLDIIYSGPYVDMSASLLETEILWDLNGSPIVWMRMLPYGGQKIKASVYHLENRLSKFLDISDSGRPVVSPDGKNCAFYSGSSVYVYDTKDWKRVNKVEGENVVSLLWKNDSTLIIGGDRTIRIWKILEQNTEILAVSSVVNGFWNNGEIIADGGNGKYFVFNEEKRTWAKSESEFPQRSNVLRNERYRLFCGETANPLFENALYIRTLFGKAVTRPVYQESVKKVSERKKIAIAFDAYDNADGLTRVLYTLNRYLVTGTFFLNGEFIRRYPNETRQISLSRNECASMFFSTSKLTQPGFLVNEDYIRRGLARNEDEFNAVAGKELSLMWHAPYYAASEKIIQDGKKAGYDYIDIKNSDFDSVTLEQAVTGKGKYLCPGELIEYYIKTLDEGEKVIPVTIGISHGTRESYLYDNLDLLISAVLDAGYEIVPLRYILEE